MTEYVRDRIGVKDVEVDGYVVTALVPLPGHDYYAYDLVQELPGPAVDFIDLFDNLAGDAYADLDVESAEGALLWQKRQKRKLRRRRRELRNRARRSNG